MNKSYTIHNLEKLDLFAQELISVVRGQASHNQATVVTLSGDLGAGKTTLTQMIGKQVGVTDPISSPTFVISKYYDLKNQPWQRLIHIDAYRLDGEPLEPLGFDDLFTDPTNLIVIEWPEYIESVLPPNRTDISISINPDESRILEIN